MPTTPNGLRYPAASDSPNGPLQVGNLAIDVDAHLNAMNAQIDRGAPHLITDFTTGGITSGTASPGTTLLSENLIVTSGDVTAGRRIVVHVRGNWGVGGNAPTVTARVNGAALDPNQAEIKLEGAMSWFFRGVPLTTPGTKTVTVHFRSTGGSVSGGNVAMLAEVI